MKLFSICFIVCSLGIMTASADSFVGDVYGRYVDVGMDTVVYEKVSFKPDYMNVSGTIEFVNNGNVDTEIHICKGCDFYVRNRGDFKANFLLEPDADIIQIVSDVDELNPIASDAEYTLMFDGFNGSLADVELTGSVVLKNSVLDLDDLTGAHSVELIGDNVLVVDDVAGMNGPVLKADMSGNGRVRLETDNTDPLYADVGVIKDGKLFVLHQRETDYEKVFKNDMGIFFNNLRHKNQADGLLQAMDNATDMRKMKQIMDKSVRLNPDVARNVGRVVREFYRNGPGLMGGLGLGTDFIYSDDFYLCGVGGRFNSDLFGVELNVAMQAGQIKYQNNLDEFDGLYYGINLSARYQMDSNLFVRGIMDFSRIDINVGDVFYDDKSIENPSVASLGGGFDVGYGYSIGDSFYLSPYVGVDILSDSLENDTRIDFAIRGGADVGYLYEVLGIKYDYVVGVVVDTDDKFMATARVGFLSKYDRAGANINLATLRFYDVWSYQVSVGVKFTF